MANYFNCLSTLCKNVRVNERILRVPIVGLFRRVASCVDGILRGKNQADLPVQAPIKYRTCLKLKAAKALGLTIPGAVLVRADEVIE
jgi:hypothetical protein